MIPTASKLGLALKCAYPFTSGTRWPKYEQSTAADFGNAVHKVAELGASADIGAIAKEHKLDASDTARLGRCAERLAVWSSAQPAAEWGYAEAAFAYDPESRKARLLEQRHHRDYSNVRKGELSGTADVVKKAGGVVIVDDYKTGRPSGVEPAASNAQLRFLALCVARVFGAPTVLTRLVYVDEYGVWTDDAELDAFDLGEVAVELAQLSKRLDGSSAPMPGPHCHDAWCPIRAVCPATLAASQEIVKLDHPLTLEIRDAEHAAYTRHRLKVVRDQIDAIEGALKEWVRSNGPVPVGSGRVYGVRTTTRESIDLTVPGAYQALIETLGEATADKAVELSTSKAAIRRAASDRGKERAAIDALGRVGAIKTSSYERLEEYEEKSA